MARPRKGEPVQKDVVFRLLPDAIAKATGGGRYESNMRGVYYVVRPGFEQVFGRELNYNTFAAIVTDYENEHGEIRNMFRDDRGMLYTPHGDAIPLGTRAVRTYERPEWTFNKIVYIEKGSHVSLLRQARWPELNDCALLTSQGQATRAVRDLFDLLGDTAEALTCFCVHDADGYGTTIYQALVGETRARPGRRIEVINLGLDPAEAIAMGLEVERVESKNRIPVASYIEPQWAEWLQANRVELNAMTSPQFIEWLDSKLAGYPGKVIPPEGVLRERLQDEIESIIGDRADQAVRERLDFDRQVDIERDRMRSELLDLEVDLADVVEGYLEDHPQSRWPRAIGLYAEELLDGGGNDDPSTEMAA